MSKRARWNGTEPVRVTFPPGAVYPDKEDVVVPGGLLSDDMPASVRDELLSREGWSEVNLSDKSSAKSEEKS